MHLQSLPTVFKEIGEDLGDTFMTAILFTLVAVYQFL